MGQFDIARLPAAEARQAAIVFAAAEATEATLAIAQALLAEGRRIDIAGLDAEVARICAAALAIRLTSPGPALFRQTRVGFRGETFNMLKLRTMYVDAEARGNGFTVDNDPRVTRIGWWLRKFRIDEFPQIVNIFTGDMSWIGPRPEAEKLSAWYASEIPFYSYRHVVRPGITGWAQVNQGNVAEVEAATYKLHYDFYYIKNFSPWLDALIVAKTVRTMLTGFGSR